MIEELAKAVERIFEINVVLPQRVVGVKDQVLRGMGFHFSGRGAKRKGISTRISTSIGSPLRMAGENCHLARASRAVRSRRSSRPRSSSTEATVPSLWVKADGPAGTSS